MYTARVTDSTSEQQEIVLNDTRIKSQFCIILLTNDEASKAAKDAL